MGRPATQNGHSSSNGAAKRVVYRRPRKDSSEVSPLIKYLLFGFNVLFWVNMHMQQEKNKKHLRFFEQIWFRDIWL